MSILTPTNYLELVQRLAFEVGVPPESITTAQNPTGQLATFCNWVNQSWLEIQSKHVDWNFMRVTPGISFATIAAQQIYTPTQAGIARGVVSAWARETFRVYTTVVGTPSEIRMSYIDYDDWRDLYQLGSLRTSQVQPVVFTILPNLSLGLQCPLVGYTITGDYFEAPLPFSADLDIPSIPPQFIMLIVYRAMQIYGLFESATEVYSQGKLLYDAMMNKLENARLPEIRHAGALA